MEINKYTDIIGVVVTSDIVEGRMVLITSQGSSHDFGSRADLMGVKLPGDGTEALLAKYIVTWPVNNAQVTDDIKMLVPMPGYNWSLRRGAWDQTGNVPFTSAVYLTYPGNQNGVTIPSGYLALAFDRGVFTVPSGGFVFSANIMAAGAPLEVLNTADDTTSAGKLSYNAAGTIAIVERFNSDDGSLTFRTL
jgi:hypothetical protein